MCDAQRVCQWSFSKKFPAAALPPSFRSRYTFLKCESLCTWRQTLFFPHIRSLCTPSCDVDAHTQTQKPAWTGGGRRGTTAHKNRPRPDHNTHTASPYFTASAPPLLTTQTSRNIPTTSSFLHCLACHSIIIALLIRLLSFFLCLSLSLTPCTPSTTITSCLIGSWCTEYSVYLSKREATWRGLKYSAFLSVTSYSSTRGSSSSLSHHTLQIITDTITYEIQLVYFFWTTEKVHRDAFFVVSSFSR